MKYAMCKMRLHRLVTSLLVQGLRLCAPTAGGSGLIPGQGTKIHNTSQMQKKKKKKKKKPPMGINIRLNSVDMHKTIVILYSSNI